MEKLLRRKAELKLKKVRLRPNCIFWYQFEPFLGFGDLKKNNFKYSNLNGLKLPAFNTFILQTKRRTDTIQNNRDSHPKEGSDLRKDYLTLQ